MFQHVFKILPIIICSLLFSNVYAGFSEGEVVTGYVFNFIKFSSWPDSHKAGQGKVVLCVIRSGSNAYSFNQLNNKKTRKGTVKIKYISRQSQVNGCHAVFIPKSSGRNVSAFASAGKKNQVLTISDSPGFINKGGMIGFKKVSSNIKFEVNYTRAKQGGIKISSELLNLALRVR